MQHYLMTAKYDYADEFDTVNVQVITSKEYDTFLEDLENTEFPVEMGFGTNEAIYLSDKEEVLYGITLTPISEDTYNEIKPALGYKTTMINLLYISEYSN